MKDLNSIFDNIESIEDDKKFLSNEKIQKVIPTLKIISMKFATMISNDETLKEYADLVKDLNNDEKLYVYDLSQRYVNSLLKVLSEKPLVEGKER